MDDSPKIRRKPIRTGLGVALLVVGLFGGYTTLRPSPGIARAKNGGELTGMLLGDAVLLGAGVYLVIEGKPAREPHK